MRNKNQEINEKLKLEQERLQKLYESAFAIEDVYTSFNKSWESEENWLSKSVAYDKDNEHKNHKNQTLILMSRNEQVKTVGREKSWKNPQLEEYLKVNVEKDQKPTIMITNEWIDTKDTL